MKRKVLLVSDSPFLDTGFGRVCREIGTGLVLSGKYDVVALGWFHHFSNGNNRLVPFRIIPTDFYTGAHGQADAYGQITYPKVVEREKPDLVLFIGDEWMVKHAVNYTRDHKLAVYIPIDCAPLLDEWADTLRQFDQVIAYGNFGEHTIRRAAKDISVIRVPHGVDTKAFRPLSGPYKIRSRERFGDDGKFVVGCVARNNKRKNIPRLLKAFRQFINPATTCPACGNVDFKLVEECSMCGNRDNLAYHHEKKDALLYLHTVADDPSGHKLLTLIRRFNLAGFVGLPDNLEAGRGVADDELNELYNAMDLFTLPTMGEGWGLPILEAMSAGVPVLVTNYSGHVEFVGGVGEMIKVSEFETDTSTHGERAIVDIQDYVCKLDRFYYDRPAFVAKWGPYMKACGITDETINQVLCGSELRQTMSAAGRERAESYTWESVAMKWTNVIDQLVGADVSAQVERPVTRLQTI